MLVGDGHLFMIATKIAELFPGSVLDVGCGLGWVVKHLREDHSVVANGIDVNPFAVDSRVVENVHLRSFLSEEDTYDVLLASKLLGCFDEDELNEFVRWSRVHCKKWLVILNSPGVGGEITRTTSFYKGIFENGGWVCDELQQRRLQSTTGWDCLVLTCNPERIVRKPVLTRDSVSTSIVVDCWMGPDYLRKFLDHVRTLFIRSVELVLVNTSQCPNVLSYLTPKMEFGGASLATYYLTGTQIPVVLSEGGTRSATTVFTEGMRMSSGSTVMLMRVSDQVNRSFLVHGLRHLLDHPNDSFVVPSVSVSSKMYRLGWLDSFNLSSDDLSHMWEELHIPLPYDGITLNKTPPMELASLYTLDALPRVFLVRTEDVLDVHLDSGQLAFPELDLLFSLVYKSRLGSSSTKMCSLSYSENSRFSTDELNELGQRLLDRSRRT
jgi:SAM-dependent methyltransferase